MFFCKHQSAAVYIYVTAIQGNSELHYVVGRKSEIQLHSGPSRPTFIPVPSLVDQLPFTSFPRLVCKNPRSVPTLDSSSSLLFSIPRSDRSHSPPLPIIESNMRRMEQRNGGCSRESSVCFMKFTLTRMREIKFTKKGGAGVRNL